MRKVFSGAAHGLDRALFVADEAGLVNAAKRPSAAKKRNQNTENTEENRGHRGIEVSEFQGFRVSET